MNHKTTQNTTHKVVMESSKVSQARLKTKIAKVRAPCKARAILFNSEDGRRPKVKPASDSLDCSPVKVTT